MIISHARKKYGEIDLINFKVLIKLLLITVVSLAAGVFGGVYLGHKVIYPIATSSVPTIEALTDGTLTLGVQAHLTQPATIDEYIPILAKQIKRYNEVAPDLWPDNALINQSAVVEDIKKKRFWLISPDGVATSITRKEALDFGFSRNAYTGGFSFYEGGMYLAVSEEDLTNYLLWQQYLHLGTFDSILFLTHEGFHAKEQSKWQTMDVINNRDRNSFLENTPARAKRDLLQKQLMKAVREPDDTQLVLEALATYVDWKNEFPDDYENSLYFDRIEGTANYYELITGLYTGYPDQINSRENLHHALALLATREDVYLRHGLVRESYTIGIFSCVLLDKLDNNWKEQLMNDPEATPIEMLFQYYKDKTLPLPQQLTQSEIETIALVIQQPIENRGMPLLLKTLYDILFRF